MIGAGSASLGLNATIDTLRTSSLSGVRLSLIDTDGDPLEQLLATARRISNEWTTEAIFVSRSDRQEVLEGADFMVIFVAVDRKARCDRITSRTSSPGSGMTQGRIKRPSSHSDVRTVEAPRPSPTSPRVRSSRPSDPEPARCPRPTYQRAARAHLRMVSARGHRREVRCSSHPGDEPWSGETYAYPGPDYPKPHVVGSAL